jgi:hypothetical protein
MGEGGAADEEEDDDDDEEPEDWTLRKCAAAGLDVMSTVYGDECADEHKGPGGDILALLLPHLHAILQSPEWQVRESGILALGAIAEGCNDGMEAHLPKIIPFLITALVGDTSHICQHVSHLSALLWAELLWAELLWAELWWVELYLMCGRSSTHIHGICLFSKLTSLAMVANCHAVI